MACQANEIDTVETLIIRGADLNCLNNVSKLNKFKKIFFFFLVLNVSLSVSFFFIMLYFRDYNRLCI